MVGLVGEIGSAGCGRAWYRDSESKPADYKGSVIGEEGSTKGANLVATSHIGAKLVCNQLAQPPEVVHKYTL